MKEITKLRELGDFPDLDSARNFEYITETYRIQEGIAKQYLLTPSTADRPRTVDPTFPNKWSHLRSIEQELTHPLSSIFNVLLERLRSNGYFEIDPNTDAGRGNLLLASSLLGTLFVDVEDMNEFLNTSIRSTSPYAEVTEEEYTKARAAKLSVGVTVVEQPVSYTSNDYIIKTPNQDFEFDINVTDGSLGNVWDIRLEVCEVEGGQHDEGNWYEVTNAFTPVRQGKLATTKWQIPYNSKRTKLYCRFYATSRKPCEYDVSVKGV